MFQVPLTYRHAPVADLEAHVICTMVHTVLGDRWVYGAIGDEGTLIDSVADFLVIPRPDASALVTGDQKLTGTWGDHAEPTLLAVARLHPS